MTLNLNIAREQLLVLFEQHLFILADPFVTGEIPSIVGDYVKTQMDFKGDINGRFTMLFPEDKSIEVMGNFLGLAPDDPQISEMTSVDAASEIMNILGAHILSSWLNDRGHFSIGLPETSVFLSNDQTEFLDSKNITGILIDGEPIFLKIDFK